MNDYPKKQIVYCTIRHGRKDIAKFLTSCDMLPENTFITVPEKIQISFTATAPVNLEDLKKNLKLAYESIGHYVHSVKINRIEDINP